MSIFSDSALQKRQKSFSQNLDPVLQNGDAILIFSGSPATKPGGLDQAYPFLPHPEYFWLSGERRFGGVMVYSKAQGFTHFVQPMTQQEAVWEGGVTENLRGQNISTLPEFLRSQNFDRIFTLGQVGPKEQVFAKKSDSGLLDKIEAQFDAARRMKDEEEVRLVKHAASIANYGYVKLKNFIKPGVSEKEIQIEFEAEVQRHGAHKFPYDTIVGAGVNASTLHAIPTNKIVGKEDLVLIDAGVDLHDYCVDITRVFPASGKFDEKRQALYDLVKDSQRQAMAACKPGVEWSEVHLVSAKVIAEGLRSFGILKGSVDSAVDAGVMAVFYPHGVGHMVGLRVRDVGYRQNKNPKKYGGVFLRVDFKLQENFMMTVEPGCYFIPALLDDPDKRREFAGLIDWSELEHWKNIGGVRIEDDIIVRASGAENLTAVVAK